MPDLRVFPSPSDQAQAAADLFVAWGQEALKARGVFRAALSGGSGPLGLFAALAQRPQALDWARVELYWVDERWVAPTDPASNYGEARRHWLDLLPMGPDCSPMFNPQLQPDAAAQAYAELLQARTSEAVPVLDLILLGMGLDGHTASLFPGQASLDEDRRLCLALRHPSTGQSRLTLTLPVLNAGRRCVFLLQGSEKAALLAEVLAGASTLPAARIRPSQGELIWLVDGAAAALVR